MRECVFVWISWCLTAAARLCVVTQCSKSGCTTVSVKKLSCTFCTSSLCFGKTFLLFLSLSGTQEGSAAAAGAVAAAHLTLGLLLLLLHICCCSLRWFPFSTNLSLLFTTQRSPLFFRRRSREDLLRGSRASLRFVSAVVGRSWCGVCTPEDGRRRRSRARDPRSQQRTTPHYRT